MQIYCPHRLSGAFEPHILVVIPIHCYPGGADSVEILYPCTASTGENKIFQHGPLFPEFNSKKRRFMSSLCAANHLCRVCVCEWGRNNSVITYFQIGPIITPFVHLLGFRHPFIYRPEVKDCYLIRYLNILFPSLSISPPQSPSNCSDSQNSPGTPK